MFKLASVQLIKEIQPIEGADNIVLAFVLGWQVVIKKDEYQVGDKVSYIQIDTVMPEKPEYEFLRTRKFRIKTIKLKKQLSQGLIVSLPKGNWKEGDDLTDILGVKKYEKIDNNPQYYESIKKPKTWCGKMWFMFLNQFFYKFFPLLRKKIKSPFPTDIVSITDEERIQNIPKVLLDYFGITFYLRYKLDGSSITIIRELIKGKLKYRICSRRFELHDKNNDWYKVFESTKFKNHIENIASHYGNPKLLVVQGEAIGKFNGNHHNIKEEEIRLFNIFVDGSKKSIIPSEFETVCVSLGIPHCPLYKTLKMNFTMDEILKISLLKDVINPNAEAEGLVWRSTDGEVSFKVINNNYLLKEK